MKHKLYKFVYCCWFLVNNDFVNAKPTQQQQKVKRKLVQIIPKNESQLMQLQLISINNSNFDFWTQPTSINQPVDLVLNDDQFNVLQSEFESLHTKIEDVDDLIKFQNTQYQEDTSRFNFYQYQTLDSINNYVSNLPRWYPNLVTVEQIGRSSQNRPINAIHVTSQPSLARPAIIIEAGIHAREWLLTSNSSDPRIKSLIDKFEWHFMPQVNPDGYEYTWTTDRLWRKSRAVTNTQGCLGVDLNRNFDSFYGYGQSGTYSCSAMYQGEYAFSEPESRAIRDFVLRQASHTKLYIGLHSYWQQWIHSYTGSWQTKPADSNDIVNMGWSAATAASKMYGAQYDTGLGPYEAGGTSLDWAYQKAGIKYAFTVELRPYRPGNANSGVAYGFLLPADQIIPTGEETFEAILELANRIEKEYAL